MKNVRLSYIISTVVLLMVILGCKKVTFPDGASKEIIGSWEYQYNTGGFSGSGGSNKYKDDNWVEFTDKGYFIVYTGSKKESKKRFKIEMRESIYDLDLRPALVYKIGYETYQIDNNVLYISDEAYDGYTYVFKKK